MRSNAFSSSALRERFFLQRRALLGGALVGLSGCTLRFASGGSGFTPPMLREGDTVGLFAPSGVIDEARIERSAKNLALLGLKVHLAPNLRAKRGNYAGTISERVSDIHTMFADPAIRALWAVRGGSGAAALLPHLDYGLIAANPKSLIGYSDITALHLALLARAGLVSYHGPVSASTYLPYTVDALKRLLFESRRPLVFEHAPENLARAERELQFAPRTLTRYRFAEGRLIGGNLSVLSAMVGSPYLPSFEGALLFLEEVDEAPYRVDRMLTHLSLAGVFERVAGVVIGVMQGIRPKDNDPSVTLEDVLHDHFAHRPYAVATGYSFGHIAPQMTLPVGAMAKLDTAPGTLTIL